MFTALHTLRCECVNYKNGLYVNVMTIFVMVLVAPGGTVVEDADKTKVSRSEVCVFAADENLEAIKAYATVSTRNSGVFL